MAVLAVHHARHVPTFAARLAAAGLDPIALETAAGRAALPILARGEAAGDAMAAPAAALPAGHGPIGHVSTAGATAAPLKVARSALNRIHWLALSMRFHLWGDPDLRGGMAAIRARLSQAGPMPDLGVPASLLFETGPGLLIDVATPIADQHAALAAFRPSSILLHPSTLEALLDMMAAGADGLPSVERWRTLGEPVSPALRQRLGAAHPGRLIVCYSTEELGYIALECPDVPGHYHVMDEMLLVEIVDDAGHPVAPGEIGRVIVTDLHNFASAMIRYDSGDFAMAGAGCACGRGLSTLGRVMGRARNRLADPDGGHRWLDVDWRRLRELAPISAHQLVQTGMDRFTLRYAAPQPLGAAAHDRIMQMVSEWIGRAVALDFVMADAAALADGSGKSEPFISMIDHDEVGGSDDR